MLENDEHRPTSFFDFDQHLFVYEIQLIKNRQNQCLDVRKSLQEAHLTILELPGRSLSPHSLKANEPILVVLYFVCLEAFFLDLPVYPQAAIDSANDFTMIGKKYAEVIIHIFT